VSVPKQHAVLVSSIKSCLTHIETMIETHSAVARKPAPPLPPKPSRINKPTIPPKPTRVSRPPSPVKEVELQGKKKKKSN
jgi:hypothetical protein